MVKMVPQASMAMMMKKMEKYKRRNVETKYVGGSFLG
jgi:hypothetical protein